MRKETLIRKWDFNLTIKQKLTKQEQQTKDNLQDIKLASKSKNPRPSLWKWSIFKSSFEYLISEHKNLQNDF